MMNKKVNILNRVRITDFSFGSSQHYDWSCFCFKKKKKKEIGTSLVVQWLKDSMLPVQGHEFDPRSGG